MMLKSPEMPAEMPPSWGVYFAVADTDATVAKAQELGASLFMGPTDIEPGRFAVLADNVGAVFNVLQLKGIAAATDGTAPPRTDRPREQRRRAWAVPPAGRPASKRRGSGSSWLSTAG